MKNSILSPDFPMNNTDPEGMQGVDLSAQVRQARVDLARTNYQMSVGKGMAQADPLIQGAKVVTIGAVAVTGVSAVGVSYGVTAAMATFSSISAGGLSYAKGDTAGVITTKAIVAGLVTLKASALASSPSAQAISGGMTGLITTQMINGMTGDGTSLNEAVKGTLEGASQGVEEKEKLPLSVEGEIQF